MKNRIGLFIGRFQPFHLGHFSVIEKALEEVDHLIIGIGSAQYSHTKENPFTLKERTQMIHSALDEAEIAPERFDIKAIPDIHNNPEWPAHVRSIVPHFDVIYTGSDIVKELFTKHDNVEIKPVEFEHGISATEIRKAIKKNKGWKEMVPDSSVEILNRMEAQKRV